MPPETATAELLAPTTISFADIDESGTAWSFLSNADTETPQLWLQTNGAPASRVTDHLDRVTLGKFRPGGGALLYGLDDGGDERQQLHLLDIASGRSRALTNAPHAIHDFGGFSPDGAAIAYASNTANSVDFDVWVHPLDGEEPKCVLRGQGLRTVEAFSPCGRFLAVATQHGSSIGELHLLDIKTGAVGPLLGTAAHGVAKAVRFLPDGDLLLLTDTGREHMGLARLARSGGALTWRLTPDADVEALVLSKDKTRFAVALNHHGYHTVEVHRLDGTGAPVLFPLDGVVGDLKWQPDGKALLGTVQTPVAPPRPHRLELESGTVTPLEGFEAAPRGVHPELVHFPTFDGRRIPAFLYEPVGPAPEGGRPAVVVVHGGPESQARPNYQGYLQAFVERGWAVFVPNVRGSSGYGRTYASLDDRERRMDSVEDLLHGARWLGTRSRIDAERIAVMGQSYGGFMVLAALTEAPDLWKTGVEFYGIADFNTLLRDTGAYRRNHRATEYGDHADGTDFLASISPLAKVERIAVPLFVAHGLSDPRVAPFESQQLVAAMGAAGKPVTSLTIPKEGHGFVKRANRLEVFGGVLSFLDNTL